MFRAIPSCVSIFICIFLSARFSFSISRRTDRIARTVGIVRPTVVHAGIAIRGGAGEMGESASQPGDPWVTRVDGLEGAPKPETPSDPEPRPSAREVVLILWFRVLGLEQE